MLLVLNLRVCSCCLIYCVVLCHCAIMSFDGFELIVPCIVLLLYWSVAVVLFHCNTVMLFELWYCVIGF